VVVAKNFKGYQQFGIGDYIPSPPLFYNTSIYAGEKHTLLSKREEYVIRRIR